MALKLKDRSAQAKPGSARRIDEKEAKKARGKAALKRRRERILGR